MRQGAGIAVSPDDGEQTAGPENRVAKPDLKIKSSNLDGQRFRSGRAASPVAVISLHVPFPSVCRPVGCGAGICKALAADSESRCEMLLHQDTAQKHNARINIRCGVITLVAVLAQVFPAMEQTTAVRLIICPPYGHASARFAGQSVVVAGRGAVAMPLTGWHQPLQWYGRLIAAAGRQLQCLNYRQLLAQRLAAAVWFGVALYNDQID